MTDRARSYVPPFLVVLGFALLVAGCMTRAPAPVVERAPFPSTRPAPPPSEAAPARGPEAPPTYIVRRGDTLYQIALDHGLDYRELAAWNNIENVNVIRVGQVLLLGPPGGQGGATTAPLVTTAPVTPSAGEVRPPALAPSTSGRPNTPTLKTEPRAVKVPFSEHALAQLQQQPVTAAAIAPEARATAPPASATMPALPPRTESGRGPEIDDDNLGWIWPTTGKIVAGFSESANLK